MTQGEGIRPVAESSIQEVEYAHSHWQTAGGVKCIGWPATDSSASFIAISPLAVMFAAGYIGGSGNGQILQRKRHFWQEEEMRFTRQSRILTLLSVLSAFAPLAWADDSVEEKNWLKEATWPAFVAEHRLKIADKDDAVTKLLKERYNEGQQELRNRYIYWLQGEETLLPVYDAARRVIEARLEAGEPGVDKVAVFKEKLAFAKLVEKQAEKIARKDTIHAADGYCARYFRANTELELIRAEKEAKRDIEK